MQWRGSNTKAKSTVEVVMLARSGRRGDARVEGGRVWIVVGEVWACQD